MKQGFEHGRGQPSRRSRQYLVGLLAISLTVGVFVGGLAIFFARLSYEAGRYVDMDSAWLGGMILGGLVAAVFFLAELFRARDGSYVDGGGGGDGGGGDGD